MTRETAIPGTLNLCILLGAASGLTAMLWLASHTGHWWLAIGAAVVFSFLNNTMYSLMHEAVHRHFHANPVVNEMAGRIIAGFFPTAFALQRVFHLAHHSNNRTEHERFDYIAPGENRGLKYLQWYCILTGLYWIALPVASIVYFFAADLIRWRHLFTHSGAGFARQTAARPYLDAVDNLPVWRVRFDILVAASVQALLIWGLDLSLFGWAICYAAFAVNWSSLQYTDHAFSDLDRHDGAWNLAVGPISRWVFLNYHYHLVHHRDPSIPWCDLPQHVQSDDPHPSFWSIYLKMWGGPRPLPKADETAR